MTKISDVKPQIISEFEQAGQSAQKLQYPTEVVDLTTDGKVYSKDNPLSKGSIDMKFMTTKEEDILTSSNLISKGIVIDRLLASLVVDPIDWDSMTIGDRNCIMIAARIMGYGKDYKFAFTCPACDHTDKNQSVDLTKFNYKKIDFSKFEPNTPYFTYILPQTNVEYKLRLVTYGLETAITNEINALKELSPESDHEVSTRLKHVIVSIDGNSDTGFIRAHVDQLRSLHSRELRKAIRDLTPDVDRTATITCTKCRHQEEAVIHMDATFFWPDARS